MKYFIPSFFAIALFLFSSCKKESDKTKLILNNKTIVVNSRTDAALIAVDSSHLIYQGSSDQLNTVTAGSIMVSGVTSNAPNGYLRKVIQVTNVSGQTILSTRNAALTDAIDQCSIVFHKHFTVADTMSYKNNDLSFGGHFDFDFANGITASGSFTAEPDLIFELDIQGAQVTHLKLGATMTENMEMHLTDQLFQSQSVNREETFFEYPMTPIPIDIFGFPLIITPNFKAKAGVSAELSGTLDVGYTATCTQTAYAMYNQSGGWTTFKDYQFVPTPGTVSLNGNATAKTYIKPIMEFSLYDISSVESSVEAEAYLLSEGNCSVSSSGYYDCSWDAKAGISADANIKVGAFGFNIVDKSISIFDYNKIIYQYGNASGLTPFNLSNPSIQFTAYNDCMIDTFAYGSSNQITVDYDNSVFDPSYQSFDIRNTTTFEDGTVVTLYYSSSDPSVSVYYPNTIQLNYCTRFGSSANSYCDEEIVILNSQYKSNPLKIRLYRPAGANKSESGAPGVRQRH